jgi:hypothetical protein
VTYSDDVLAALQEKLPSHTFTAVERRAESLGDDERAAYLSRILAERERSEAAEAGG